MGCCGDREKDEFLTVEQKWDYINLDDFKAQSCWTPFAYGYLIVMLVVSISIYVVDTFTAINLLAFDRWSGQIQPKIPLTIARWIFAGCIIASFVLLAYRWLRAVRVMRKGGVAKSYLDPLAVRVQCIRPGKTGRGFRRFLVFAELTKSRKGADYVALFAHYSFEAWMRICFAEGPRQVVNAITLWSVMQAKLIPVGEHAATNGHSAFVQFWVNVGLLFDENRLQGIILIGMLWTLFVWVISALSLALSVVLYLIFLWHHIPAQDGNLTVYCRKKINRRMERIVKVKVDKALKKENELRNRQDARAAKDGYDFKKQPTLPDVGGTIPALSRTTTMTTLPEYESRPGSIRSSGGTVPPLPTQFGDGKPGLSRHATQASTASWTSYSSNAPLMQNNGDIESSPVDRMNTPGSSSSQPWSVEPRPFPNRSNTGFSQFSERSMTPGYRPGTAQSGYRGPGTYQMEPLPRPGTSSSMRTGPGMSHAGADGSYFPSIADQGSSQSTSGFDQPTRTDGPMLPPIRSNTPLGLPMPRSNTPTGVPLRSYTPQGLPPRSLTASVPPPRSFTPGGLPPRSFSPQLPPATPSHFSDDTPTLPRMDLGNNVGNTTYKSFNPTTTTSLPRSSSPAESHQQPSYRSFSRPNASGPSANRDSGVDDVLNHY